MSVVTNVILCYEEYEILGPNNRLCLGVFNKELCEHAGEGYGLVHVEDATEDGGWYGGTKCLEADIAIGAFNHFEIYWFIAAAKMMVAKYPDTFVQLLVKEQDDDFFQCCYRSAL